MERIKTSLTNLTNRLGMTLIELLFVLAIFGLLTAAAIAGVTYLDNVKAKTKIIDTECAHGMRQWNWRRAE